MAKAKRLAVIDRELCKPMSGNYACMKVCPVNRSGKECVTIAPEDKKPVIDEVLCIGCGICVKKCPTGAISVVNLPHQLDENPIHRYGRNLFSLFRLPIPKARSVIGLIGPNGVGKTTVLNIFSGEIKPNTGLFDNKVQWEDIIKRFRGTELQDYVKKLSEGGINAAYKPQHVDMIPNMYKGKVSGLLKKIDKGNRLDSIVKDLDIAEMMNKDVSSLSGGELQLFAVAGTLLKDADFYFFDEPSSYLDVQERLIVARVIRKLVDRGVVMIVEHDLAVADYLADVIHILYGKPGIFGVVSKPYSVLVGINTYLEGYIKEENMRFRPKPIIFRKQAKASEKINLFMEFPAFEKKFKGFSMTTEPGEIHKGEVIGILGPNSIGKTTFIKMLVGDERPDATKATTLARGKTASALANLKLAYKTQRLIISKQEEAMTIRQYLTSKSKSAFNKENKRLLYFLGLEKLMERRMGRLSGGELQSVLICSVLVQDYDILLMDEPSAFLDVEQRLRVAKLVRSAAEAKEKPCFVVDHDLQFIDAVADRIMVFEGEKGVKGHGLEPVQLEKGMNKFLKALGITFRRDPQTGRPRANKPGSQKDVQQKQKGRYYYV